MPAGGASGPEVVLATGNRAKAAEIMAVLAGLGLRFLTLADFSDLPEVVEDGRSFQENALKKARAVAKATGRLAIADDSGLEVEALGGRPGIHSARYAGPGATDAQNNACLLAELEGVPPERRGAAFRCVIAVCTPEGECRLSEGRWQGAIATEPRGSHGFGYDPLFIVPEAGGVTSAELAPEVKNRLSHRGKALRGLREVLREMISGAQGPP